MVVFGFYFCCTPGALSFVFDSKRIGGYRSMSLRKVMSRNAWFGLICPKKTGTNWRGILFIKTDAS
jgi:hypothetical protein